MQNNDFNDRYIFALDRLAASDFNAKSNYVGNLSILDKLFNDYLGYALLTLGAAIAILTTKNDIIKTHIAFIAALIVLGFVAILCSYVRSRIHKIISQSSKTILEEYNQRLNAIDSYRINPSDENKGTMNSVLGSQRFTPNKAWFETFGSDILVSMYIAAVLLLIISLAFRILP